MSQPPSLDSYSSEDLELIKRLSPAASRYIDLIPRLPHDSIHSLRHKAWTECAAATLLQRSHAKEVCHYWSNTADNILKQAWRDHGLDAETSTLFALGKLGARELNLSSDVDLMIVSLEAPSSELFKKTRQFIHTLSATSASGFCFRVDMDLRPGGKFSPLVCSVSQFQDYYWSLGETWERLALVRLRPIAGDDSLQNQVIDIASRYCYRKHLDYGLLEDLKSLRSKIHHHLPRKDQTINIKLVPGGIRDVELFIHALQVIHGGKIPDLRTTSTDDAVAKLKVHSLFRAEDLDLLRDSYWEFRQIENEVQAKSDEHAHDFEMTAKNSEGLNTKLIQVDKIVTEVLGRPSRKQELPASPEDQEAFLKGLGFNDLSTSETWPKLISLTAVSTRTFEDEKVRRTLLFDFCKHAAGNAIDPDLALNLLTDFIRNTRAKTSFFYLLHQNPKLISELSMLFGCSPHLGGILSSRPELLDTYLFRSTASRSTDFEVYLEELVERRLMTELLSSTDFLKKLDVDKLCHSLSLVADEITLELAEQIREQYGGNQVGLLALGKWGSCELGVRSDLDFIFLMENTLTEEDHKSARRFLTRLSESHRGGSIYKIDLRLRPSGKAGPLMLEKKALMEYLSSSANPWERQTYLRSRLVGSDGKMESGIRKICVERGFSAEELAELTRIREDLHRPYIDQIDIKFSPGGILDAELAMQTALIAAKKEVPSASTKDLCVTLSQLDSRWLRLEESLRQCRLTEQALHLVQGHGGSKLEPGTPAFSRLAKLLKIEEGELLRRVKDTLSDTDQLLKLIDPRRLSS